MDKAFDALLQKADHGSTQLDQATSRIDALEARPAPLPLPTPPAVPRQPPH